MLTALVAAPIVMHSGVKAYVMTSPWVTMLVRCTQCSAEAFIFKQQSSCSRTEMRVRLL